MVILKELDEELAHVFAEAENLEHNAPEPAYVEVLLQAINRLPEAGLPAVQQTQATSQVQQPEPSPAIELPEPTNETRWIDTPPLEDVPQAPADEVQDVTSQNFGCKASWQGDPDDYQGHAAVALVASGVAVTPWSWVVTTCGNDRCLEVAHMHLQKPQRLLYPSGICTYCGEYADTRDHLLPATFTGKAVRRHVLTVPACRQCNSRIGDAYAPSITERRAIAQNGLRRKHFRLLQSYDYTDEELEEFGHAMKSSVLRAREEKARLLRRLEFPGDDSYDLEYLSQSGIENPYAFGLVKSGQEARERHR